MPWIPAAVGAAVAAGTAIDQDSKNPGTGDPSKDLNMNNKGFTVGTNGYQDMKYASQSAFQDPNAGAIYRQIGQGYENSGAASPTVQQTTLGKALDYNGQQLASPQMVSGAKIAPQMLQNGPQLNTAQDQQYATAQNQTINQLAQQAAGQGPSVAEQAAHNQASQNIAAQMAALGSQRGSGSAATAQRAAATQAAEANQAAAHSGALGRSQEALQAQSQLSQALAGARGQSQTTAQTQAQLAANSLNANQSAFNSAAQNQAALNQAAGMANQQTAYNAANQNSAMAQQAGLSNQAAQNARTMQQGSMTQQSNLAQTQADTAQNQLNEQTYAAMLQAQMGQNSQDMSAAAAYQQLIGQQQLNVAALKSGKDISDTNNAIGLVGAGVSALSGLASAASDKRLKKDIRPADRSLQEFLNVWSR